MQNVSNIYSYYTHTHTYIYTKLALLYIYMHYDLAKWFKYLCRELKWCNILNNTRKTALGLIFMKRTSMDAFLNWDLNEQKQLPVRDYGRAMQVGKILVQRPQDSNSFGNWNEPKVGQCVWDICTWSASYLSCHFNILSISSLFNASRRKTWD